MIWRMNFVSILRVATLNIARIGWHTKSSHDILKVFRNIN
jgi:hypothetical protein